MAEEVAGLRTDWASGPSPKSQVSDVIKFMSRGGPIPSFAVCIVSERDAARISSLFYDALK